MQRTIPLTRGLCRLRQQTEGVTVVSVNYRSLDALEVLVKMVRRHSSADVQVLIVDNESTSAARSWMISEGVRFVRLPLNIGHSSAMDLGWMLASTEYVVALDIDAFPIADDWLDRVIAPLESGSLVAGGRVTTRSGPRAAVHPCFLAMKRKTFLNRKLSFKATGDLDVGESITMSVGVENAHHIEQTEVRGPGHVGSVFDDVVYHNFYGTRFSEGARSTIDVVHRDDAAAAWSEAVARWV